MSTDIWPRLINTECKKRICLIYFVWDFFFFYFSLQILLSQFETLLQTLEETDLRYLCLFSGELSGKENTGWAVAVLKISHLPSFLMDIQYNECMMSIVYLSVSFLHYSLCVNDTQTVSENDLLSCHISCSVRATASIFEEEWEPWLRSDI